jgi:agmatine deiminase
MTNFVSERDARAATDVFVSDLLKARHPSFHHELGKQIARFGLALREIPGTRDIWCRDYMPVPIAEDRFVQFRYEPDYLADACHLITPPEVAKPICGRSCRGSELIADGGNIVRRGGIAILTERILAENATLSRKKVECKLRDELEVDRLIAIPVEPGDIFGHADGIVQFVDDELVLVNDYDDIDRAYGRRVVSALRRHHVDPIPIPYAPTYAMKAGIPSAVGVYVNLLETQRAIFVPRYSRSSDDRAAAVIERVARGRAVLGIQCASLATGGGSLRCATWSA